MFCPHCGEQIATEAEICPKCGVRVKKIDQVDQPNIPVNILSVCCAPILGIIMYFVWKDDKPKAAKSALTWGIASIAIWILLSIIFGILGFLLGSTEDYYY